MAFNVYYLRGDRYGHDAYDDSHELAVKDSGVLEVTQDGKQVKLYGASYWAYVVPDEPNTKDDGVRAWVLQ